jgi:bifunctional non-homologous end joining protein LigD
VLRWKATGHLARLPELAGLADVVGVPVVLDGELVAGQGRASDSYGVLRRVARSAQLSFVAFDVLAYDGAPVIDEPYARRRELLDGLGLRDNTWCTAPQLFGSVLDVLACARGMTSRASTRAAAPGSRTRDNTRKNEAGRARGDVTRRQSRHDPEVFNRHRVERS